LGGLALPRREAAVNNRKEPFVGFIKSKALAVAAVLALVGGIGTAGALTAGTAGAATPSCGISCVDVFSQQFGTHLTPNYALDVFRQGEKTGQPVILFRTANFDPALDWSAGFDGTTADFYAAGLVSSSLALHYGCVPETAPGIGNFPSCANPLGGPAFPDDWAFENQYAPFGVDSGLCLGVAATAYSGEGVTLQPCGVSAKTVWIIDQNDASSARAALNEYVPLINGSDTNFSQPFVLTYPANGFPTDRPRPQLTVTNLTGFTNPSTGDPEGVSSLQMWGADFGTLK
jgi:hypothetical protein